MSQLKHFGGLCLLALAFTLVMVGAVSAAPRQLLQNGDFSQGLQHWQAQSGWSVAHGVAQLDLDHTASGGINSLSAVLCSDAYAFGSVKHLRGTANLYEYNPNNGYVIPGVRWFDARGERLSDYAFGYDHHARKKWVTAGFETDIPHGAKRAAFCFFGAAYAGKRYRAQADNANLQ